jgi:hypothetical protein
LNPEDAKRKEDPLLIKALHSGPNGDEIDYEAFEKFMLQFSYLLENAPKPPVKPDKKPSLMQRLLRRKAGRAPEQQFTLEQLVSMHGLVKEKLQNIEESRQAIIDKGAHEGRTIATEAVLRHLEASKAAHQGADREAYTAAADKLTREFREKYPDRIPVDEAYRLMKEWE